MKIFFRAFWQAAALGLAAVALSPSTAQAQAVIEGRVELPPPVKARALAQRYEGGKPVVAPPPPPIAAVYLEGRFSAPVAGGEAKTAELPQQGFQFVRRILPIETGTTVIFPNKDKDFHNVASYSKAKPFDLGRYQGTENPPSVQFDKPGVVELDCEIHSHMRCTILVLETPHFVLTDTNGVYRIENLPPGKYELKAWINPKTVYSKPVELGADSKLTVNFPEHSAR